MELTPFLWKKMIRKEITKDNIDQNKKGLSFRNIENILILDKEWML